MMAYLLHIETGTGDSDTSIMALMCQGPGHRQTGGGQGMGFVTGEEKHKGLNGLTKRTLEMEFVTAQRKA